MAYLMHIGFDNSSRLGRDTYYFYYKGIRYKLIQNNIRKHCDVLITKISGSMSDCEKGVNSAYIIASEFLSALAWENNAKVKLRHLGGPGVRDTFPLRRAKCSMSSWPEVPFQGYTVGYDICNIPEIETEEQKEALTLFREANSCNNFYLSFLFFWQVLETGKGNAINWINRALRENRSKIRLSHDDFSRLPLNGKKLGHYLYDDCRNAIAHIRRKSNRVKLKLDTPEENKRIIQSMWVIKEFARFYISSVLALNKRMYLIREKGRGFPVYVNEEHLINHRYEIAYKRLSLDQVRRKRWH